ncbi:DUF2523 domain-containing protein [Vibrio fluminensis]|uniref:DUF2523 domain-containing protein n=1 Tax=Vibrio fluminensis TaxID=2783614 RepID=UPI001886D531|nr:DUF2523 domain-containing protein [Vibrio fluminensis]
MPYFLTFLATLVVPMIPSIVRGLVSYTAVSVGFSLVAYTGLNLALDTLVDFIQSNLNGLPSDLASIVAISGFPQAVNAFLTCLVFSFTLSGLFQTTGYRPSWRRPSNPTGL